MNSETAPTVDPDQDGFGVLIEALTLFRKYHAKTCYTPTHCEHDVLMVMAPKAISPEDVARLKELSFTWSNEYDCWASFRFGSA